MGNTINIGTSEIDALYYGSSEVTEVYFGSTLVWPAEVVATYDILWAYGQAMLGLNGLNPTVLWTYGQVQLFHKV